MNEWIEALRAEAAEIENPTERMWWLATGTLSLYLKGVSMHMVKFGLALFLVFLGAVFTLWDGNTVAGILADGTALYGKPHTIGGQLPWLWVVLVGLGVLARVLQVSHRTLLFGAALYIPLCHLIDVSTAWTIPFSFDVPEGALALVLLMLGWSVPVQHSGKNGPLHRFVQQKGLHG